MTSLLRRTLIALSLLVVVGLSAAWFAASALIAPQQFTIGAPPAGLNAIAFTVPSESGSMISGWHTRPEPSNGVAAKRGVIVLLHGVRGSRLAMVDRARMLHAAGYATVMIDFQSHGESPGREITMGYLERHDVRAAVAYARREHPGEPVGAIGVSLGGAAALLASPLEIDALVVEAVYTTIDEAVHNRVADLLGPLAPIPTSLLLVQLQPRLGFATSELRPIDHIARVGCPVFVLSGTSDRHTTPADTEALFAAAKDPKQLWMVDGAQHVDLYEFDRLRYRERMLDFFSEFVECRAPAKRIRRRNLVPEGLSNAFDRAHILGVVHVRGVVARRAARLGYYLSPKRPVARRGGGRWVDDRRGAVRLSGDDVRPASADALGSPVSPTLSVHDRGGFGRHTAVRRDRVVA